MDVAALFLDPEFPPTARSLFERLYQQPTPPPHVVKARMETHMERLRRAAALDELIDLRVAEALASRLMELVQEVSRRGTAAHGRLAHTAIRYFLIEEDADSDLRSFVGFDDDAHLFNVIARSLGRPDLVIDLTA